MTLEPTPREPPPAPAGMAWLDPPAWAGSLHGFVEAVLDATVRRAVEDPLPVHTAEDVREAARAPAGATITTFVVPALARVAGRWSKGVVRLGSRLSFSVKALLQAVPPLATSVTLGTRELHALASLVVNRLRAEGLPVDRRFVQRVTVNAYVWPGGGRPLEEAQAPAVIRLAGLWATRPLAGEKAGDWVGRAADSIVAADLGRRLARYDSGPAALGP
jgi:hypothetical protein